MFGADGAVLQDEVRLNEEEQQIRTYVLITSYVSVAMEHEIARLHDQGHRVTILPVEQLKRDTGAMGA